MPPGGQTSPPANPGVSPQAELEERRRSNRNLWLAVGGLVVGLVGGGAAVAALGPAINSDKRDQRQEDRDLKEQAEEDALEAGLPLKLTPGVSYYGPSWYVNTTSYGIDQLNGHPFKEDGGDAVPSWAWLEKNWTPLSATGLAVSVESQHKTTVLVQALKLRDVDCSLPVPDGTLLMPPEVGDGGEGAPPVDMGMRVDSARPVTRAVEGLTLGGPYTRQIALDKGDAREFRIIFTTQTRACSFQADLLVYSKGKQYPLRLPSSWGAGGKPASYTFRVAPPHKPYKSHYVVGTANMLVAVPDTDIKWTGQTPAYTGNGELNYW
ncbi:hypothetical protein AB0929_28015 [Streptomyces massasporeus]|uniref:hypothetical protein n=1 Tax=Streptomyces massasporeus TaxID=67324 RepID=UPI0034572315